MFFIVVLLGSGIPAGYGQSALDGFDPRANGPVFAVVAQPDGKILFGGGFTNIAPNGSALVTRNRIARLNADGTLDTAFNPNANGVVYSIAVLTDGRILAGGAFSGTNSIGGQPRDRIARLDGTTGLADSFDPGANDVVYSIAPQADGKILAGGFFTNIGGQARNRIARLEATSGLADSFDPNANNAVYSIAVQADGKILAGGRFNGPGSIGGETRNFIARLDSTTGLADSFDPNANSSEIDSIVVQPDGKILVGGSFFSIGGQPRNGFARLDATTGLADSFDPNADGAVVAVALQADGKIFASGSFSNIGGQPRNGLARLTTETGFADSFDPAADDKILSIAIQADGKILCGGPFNNMSGQSRSLFARLSNETVALQDLSVTQTTVTWICGGSSPQFTRVTFESSTDKVNYTPMGNGIPQSGSSNWILTGLDLPLGQNSYIRARGYYRTGFQNGSESITQLVRNVFLTAPAGTATPTVTPTATAIPSPSATVGPSPTPSATPAITPCGRIIFGERFDGVTAPALPAGWVATNAAGPGPLWVTSTTTPDTAPNDAFVGAPATISDKRLDTPGIAITSSSAQLRFRNSFNMESSGGTYWDGGVLEVSSPNINCSAFTDITDPAVGAIFVTGGYTGLLFDDSENPLAGRMAWSGTSNGYINTVVNLGSNLAGQTITLRFRLGTGETVGTPGWRIDTITIADGMCPTPTPTPTATATATATAVPSPSAPPQTTPTPTPTPPPRSTATPTAPPPTATPLPTPCDMTVTIAGALPPDPYTASLAGLNNGAGVGVVELDDRSAP